MKADTVLVLSIILLGRSFMAEAVVNSEQLRSNSTYQARLCHDGNHSDFRLKLYVTHFRGIQTYEGLTAQVLLRIIPPEQNLTIFGFDVNCTCKPAGPNSTERILYEFPPLLKPNVRLMRFPNVRLEDIVFSCKVKLIAESVEPMVAYVTANVKESNPPKWVLVTIGLPTRQNTALDFMDLETNCYVLKDCAPNLPVYPPQHVVILNERLYGISRNDDGSHNLWKYNLSYIDGRANISNPEHLAFTKVGSVRFPKGHRIIDMVLDWLGRRIFVAEQLSQLNTTDIRFIDVDLENASLLMKTEGKIQGLIYDPLRSLLLYTVKSSFEEYKLRTVQVDTITGIPTARQIIRRLACSLSGPNLSLMYDTKNHTPYAAVVLQHNKSLSLANLESLNSSCNHPEFELLKKDDTGAHNKSCIEYSFHPNTAKTGYILSRCDGSYQSVYLGADVTANVLYGPQFQPYPDIGCLIPFKEPIPLEPLTPTSSQRIYGAVPIDKSWIKPGCPPVSWPMFRFAVHICTRDGFCTKEARHQLFVRIRGLVKGKPFEPSIEWSNYYMDFLGDKKPPLPTYVNATAISPDTIQLKWNNVISLSNRTAKLQYIVLSTAVAPHKSSDHTDRKQVAVSCNPSHPVCDYDVIDLQPDREYYFKIITKYMQTNKTREMPNWSNSTTFEEPGTIECTHKTKTSLTFRWFAYLIAKSEYPYQLEFYFRQQEKWKMIQEIPPKPSDCGKASPTYSNEAQRDDSPCTILVQNLEPLMLYHYKVVAWYLGTVYELFGPPAETEAGPPSAPLNLTVIKNEGRIYLRWKVPLTDGGYPIMSYEIEVRKSKSENWTKYNVSSEEKSWLVSPLLYGNLRKALFRVAAVNEQGTGPFTDPIDAGPPSAPRNLTVVKNEGRIYLRWNEPLTEGGDPIMYYEIEVRKPKSENWTKYHVSSEEKRWLVSPLLYGNLRKASFRVAAANKHGTGPFTDPIDAGPPSAPRNLTVVKNEGRIYLRWKEPLTEGGDAITSYKIEVRKPNSENWTKHHVSPEEKSWLVSPLLYGNLHKASFRVAAVNKLGTGPFTDPVDDKIEGPSKTQYLLPVSVLLGLFTISSCILAIFNWTMQRSRKRRDERYLCLKLHYQKLHEQQECVINDKIICIKYDPSLEIPFEDIRIGSLLNQGNFGLVYNGILSKDGSNINVAMKLPRGEGNIDTLITELLLMHYANGHPNVVKLMGAVTNRIMKGEFYVIMEKCVHGSLLERLTKAKIDGNFVDELIYSNFHAAASGDQTPDEHCIYEAQANENWAAHAMYLRQEKVLTSDLVSYVYQIACGMEHIHDKGIIHRDVAARNILCAIGGIIKVADFGLARLPHLTIYQALSHDIALPYKIMAPESLRTDQFSKETDVYSFGVMLWEIFSLGEQPYRHIRGRSAMREHIQSGPQLERPPLCPEPIYALIMHCCSEPNARPSFTDIKEFLQHQLAISAPKVLDELLPMNTQVGFGAPIAREKSPDARKSSTEAIANIIKAAGNKLLRKSVDSIESVSSTKASVSYIANQAYGMNRSKGGKNDIGTVQEECMDSSPTADSVGFFLEDESEGTVIINMPTKKPRVPRSKNPGRKRTHSCNSILESSEMNVVRPDERDRHECNEPSTSGMQTSRLQTGQDAVAAVPKLYRLGSETISKSLARPGVNKASFLHPTDGSLSGLPSENRSDQSSLLACAEIRRHHSHEEPNSALSARRNVIQGRVPTARQPGMESDGPVIVAPTVGNLQPLTTAGGNDPTAQSNVLSLVQLNGRACLLPLSPISLADCNVLPRFQNSGRLNTPPPAVPFNENQPRFPLAPASAANQLSFMQDPQPNIIVPAGHDGHRIGVQEGIAMQYRLEPHQPQVHHAVAATPQEHQNGAPAPNSNSYPTGWQLLVVPTAAYPTLSEAIRVRGAVPAEHGAHHNELPGSINNPPYPPANQGQMNHAIAVVLQADPDGLGAPIRHDDPHDMADNDNGYARRLDDSD